MSLIKFMSSVEGRSLRVMAGIVLIVIGFVAGGGWLTLPVIGLIPMLAGIFNVCLLAPVWGQPMKGKRCHASHYGRQ